MKKITCPVCKEKTISIKDKAELDFRFKSDLKCSNCNSYLRISKLSILLTLGLGSTVGILLLLDISLFMKVILVILGVILYYCIKIYVIPIVKDE